MKSFLSILAAFIVINSFAQTKRQLKRQIADLTTQKTTIQKERDSIERQKTTLSERLNRMTSVPIDNVITADEQPAGITIGEAGWREDLNGLKYKNDLIGQLGTIWILDSNNQIQPLGGFSLTSYELNQRL